jgi:hypothetical protein
MTAREQLRHDWAARVQDYKSSGLTMAAWCATNHFTKDQLKYWLYKSKKITSGPPSIPSTRFIPLTVTNEIETLYSASSLVVHIGQARIELRAGFDPQLLREVVQVLGMPC